ncbi:MAG TPA: hypothetical protein VHL34_20785 [Rhizomicrobium sp.]|jgi:hypothetical protein|nr:hypothetical protein [Rhizomicrobium sp.]
MDPTQFELQIAATLAGNIAGASGLKDPEAVVTLLLGIRDELAKREVINKKSAAFIPKGR